MWDYTEDVKEHYRNPKNVGEIKNPDAVGEVGSLSCGDMLKLSLRIDDKGIISDAKAQTFGCGSAVASASVLTEMIMGKHIDEASKITNKQIAEELGGLPPAKMHCSVMGYEALEAAIADYKGIEVEKDGDEHVVCKCYGTTEGELKQIIKDNKVKNFDDLTQICKTGSGCSKCCTAVKDMIECEIKKVCKPEEKTSLTKTQLILKINSVLEDEIAPKLKMDGGGIELIDIEDKKVLVKLKGACQGCSGAQTTLKNFVESTLKEQVDENIEVIQA